MLIVIFFKCNLPIELVLLNSETVFKAGIFFLTIRQHVEVSLSKILNASLLLMCSWHLACKPLQSVKGPVMSWRLFQVCTLPSPRDSWDWLQQKTPQPIKGIKRSQTMDEWTIRQSSTEQCWKLFNIYSMKSFQSLLSQGCLFSGYSGMFF